MNWCGFVLAAGAGTRMRPATLLRPKALLPFCGVPLLDLTLASLDQALPANAPVIVNACYLGEQVRRRVEELAPGSPRRLHCAVEQKLLNHGGGIRNGLADAALAADIDTILVHNVDVVTDFPLERLMREHVASGADATVLLVDNCRPDGVSVRPDGTVANFHSGAPGHTFSGIYILHRRILDYLTAGADAPSIITAFERAAAHGRRIQALVAPPATRWSDVGTYAEYIAAHRRFAAPEGCHAALQAAILEQRRRRQALEASGVECAGAIGLGAEVRVAPGAVLHDLVLWDQVRLEAPVLYSTGVVCQSPAAPPPESAAGHRIAPELMEAFGLRWDGETPGELPRQGSARKYCRVTGTDGKTLVWSAYEPYLRRENSAFAAVGRLLEDIGVRAPAILAHLPEKCELLCTDLGGQDLLELAGTNQREALLLQVMGMLARQHVLGGPAQRRLQTPMQPPFDLKLYTWERDYFRERFLGDVLGAPELWELAAAEWDGLVAGLLAEPLVPVHRDCQSANVKVQDGLAYLIDFQGMRYGAAAYDLGSLLYDPYVEYPPPLRLECLECYADEVRRLGGEPPAAAMLHRGAVQRLLQALGAYGKLWKGDGLEWYRRHIPAAVAHLDAAAEAADLPGFVGLARAIARKLQLP